MKNALSDYTFDSPRAERSINRIIAALKTGPMSANELVSAAYKSKTGVTHYVRYLRGDEERGFPKRVYIASWRESGGGHVPVYALGDKKDAKRPPRKTASERHQMVKADTEKYQKILARRRELANSPRPRSQSLASRIAEYIERNGNRIAGDIAEAMASDPRHVTISLQRLRKRGIIEIVPGTEKRRSPMWRFVGPADASKVAVPKIVQNWKIPAMPKQNPFSALGI